MLRAINYALYGIIAVALIFLALANREVIRINLLPKELIFLGFDFHFNIPIFVIFFGGVFFGVMIGFLLEWMREYRLRFESSQKTLELNSMQRQIQQLKDEKYENQDDVLTLLEETAKEMKRSSQSA